MCLRAASKQPRSDAHLLRRSYWAPCESLTIVKKGAIVHRTGGANNPIEARLWLGPTPSNSMRFGVSGLSAAASARDSPTLASAEASTCGAHATRVNLSLCELKAQDRWHIEKHERVLQLASHFLIDVRPVLPHRPRPFS